MDDISTLSEVSELEIEGADEDESESLALEANERIIFTRPSDPEIISLYEKWKRGKLDLQPFFQRQFVWDRAKASRLIESVLLAVPLPIIYLAEDVDGREAVIDGQQRLTAFFSFLDGRFPDSNTFRLTGMKVFSELNRKSYQELDETTQDKIRAYSVRTITILKQSDPNLKFEIFERLNTGAVPLNDMELRNCVYRGPYMDLLRELAGDPEFRDLVGFSRPDYRMRDIELVLRFASFYHATYLRYQSPMKRFFNADMENHRNIGPQQAKALRLAFKNSLQIVKSLFGESAFRRYYTGTESNPNGSWETKKFNASLYDVLMGVFADRDKNQVFGALDAVREGLIDLMVSNPEFIDAILFGTSEPVRVRKRFDLARMRVDDILANFSPQPRCFSFKLKQELYSLDPTCAICGNRIQVIDDAAVDHIEQYWRGGKTIPDNARLSHRYCNNARSRID